MVGIITHPIRRAKLDRTIRDARVRAHVPERPKAGVRSKHPVPDPSQLCKRNVQLRSFALRFTVSGRVDTEVQVV